jgi:hypothetical protein
MSLLDFHAQFTDIMSLRKIFKIYAVMILNRHLMFVWSKWLKRQCHISNDTLNSQLAAKAWDWGVSSRCSWKILLTSEVYSMTLFCDKWCSHMSKKISSTRMVAEMRFTEESEACIMSLRITSCMPLSECTKHSETMLFSMIWAGSLAVLRDLEIGS